MAVAKEKTGVLIDEINALDLDMEYTNPFGWNSHLKAFKRAAEELQATEVVKASIIQGMVACLMHDDQTMRAKHENAIRNAPHYYLAYYNFAQSLCRAGYYSEAVQHYEKALSLEPMIPAHYVSAAQNYALLGRWDLAEETLSRLKALTNEIPEVILFHITTLVDALNTYDLNPETIAAIKKVADDFLRQKGIHFTAEIASRRFINEGDFLYWPIFVRADRATIKELNYEFADVLASSVDEIHSDKIVFSFVEAR